jgi:hypothetical protein
MKLFGRSGGYWLFWVSVIYVIAGLVNHYAHWDFRLELIQMIYVLAISLPLWIRPLARQLNMKCLWEI